MGEVKSKVLSMVRNVCIVSTCLVGASALADGFYVENAEIVGDVSPQQRETVQEMISSSIAGRSAHEVSASITRADFIVQPKLIKQGDRYTVVVEKMDEGRIIWAGRTEPVVAENLSQNVNRLVERMLAGEGDEPIEITVIQAAPQRDGEEAAVAAPEDEREIPLRRFFLGFGPNFLPDSIDGNGDPQLGLHAAYNWDLDNALLNLFGDFVFRGSDAALAGGGIGVNYLVLEMNEATPFVGAELGYASVFPAAGGSVGGFTVNGVLGGQFFRRSVVNLEVAFHAGWFTSEVGGETPFISGVRVGIYFG